MTESSTNDAAPAETASERPLIVVGVSGRTGSPAALRWASEAANRLGGQVRAVMAWRPPRAPAAPGGHPPAVHRTGPEDPQGEASRRVEGFVAAALGADHSVESVAVRGPAVPTLLEASRAAYLLVLDSPRPNKLATMSQKLVAPQLIFLASCPVVVIPPSDGPGGPRTVRRVAERIATAAAEAAATAGRPGLMPFPPPS